MHRFRNGITDISRQRGLCQKQRTELTVMYRYGKSINRAKVTWSASPNLMTAFARISGIADARHERPLLAKIGAFRVPADIPHK